MLETVVLGRIQKYNKPIKTKHLASRLGVDRVIMAKILNMLVERKLIRWHIPKRHDDKQYTGWIKYE